MKQPFLYDNFVCYVETVNTRNKWVRDDELSRCKPYLLKATHGLRLSMCLAGERRQHELLTVLTTHFDQPEDNSE